MSVTHPLGHQGLEEFAIGLMKFIPQEHVELLEMDHAPEVSDEAFVAVPNLERLVLRDVKLLDGFLQANPDGPYEGRRLLPSLKSLHIKDVTAEDDGWQPLISYPKHQSSGGRSISLDVTSDGSKIPTAEEMAEIQKIGRAHV